LNLIDTFIGTDFQLQLIGGGPLENEVLRSIKDQPNISYLGFKKGQKYFPDSQSTGTTRTIDLF
jgi:hypothetical protein